MNRELFDALAKICPEHVYDLEHLVEAAVLTARREALAATADLLERTAEVGWTTIGREELVIWLRARASTQTPAACDCYPGGFSPESYEGPQEHCQVHGRPPVNAVPPAEHCGHIEAPCGCANPPDQEQALAAWRHRAEQAEQIARVNAALHRSAEAELAALQAETTTVHTTDAERVAQWRERAESAENQLDAEHAAAGVCHHDPMDLCSRCRP